MKKYFILALTVLLMGCSFPQMTEEGKEVRISNKYSTGKIYLPQSSIVSDNATHIVFSMDKKESQAEIKYFTYKGQ